MSLTTMTEVAKIYNKIPAQVLENIINASGLLRTMNFDAAIAGEKDIYRTFDELPTATISQFGAAIVPQSLTSANKELTLAYVTALQQELTDIVENATIDKSEYFRTRSTLYYEAIAQKLAKLFFYGSSYDITSPFRGFKEIAETNSQTIVGNSSGSSAMSTIFAIRWKPQYCTGLFNPQMMTKGMLVKSEWKHQGNSYTKTSNVSTGAEYDVFGMLHSACLGVKVVSKDLVATYTKLDASYLPTSDNMDKLCDMVKAEGGNTVLYMTRAIRRSLMKLKNTKLELINSDNGIDNRVEAWNGIPIMIDENLIDTEVN